MATETDTTITTFTVRAYRGMGWLRVAVVLTPDGTVRVVEVTR